MKETHFQQVALALKGKLFRLAMGITLCREDAEDIVQETLVRLWRQAQQPTPIDNAEALALTICHNLALDQLQRKERRNVPLDTTLHELPDNAQDPGRHLEASEQLARVRQAIAALPVKQRTALTLRDIEGHTYKEIAQTMQIGESDVKVNIFRARQRLRKTLLGTDNPQPTR